MKIRSAILFFTIFAGMVLIAMQLLPANEHYAGDLQAEKESEEGESKKDASHLFPNELFFLDRNYPDFDASPELFHSKLKEVIASDKSASRSHRGLDYPWKIEGPGNIGGRINAIAIHPLNPDIMLMGYSQGGMYRTENGGIDWEPVFDDQVSLAVSHIAFDPHDPDRVFATTGDVNISGYPFLGSGIYRSDDAGVHWSYSGLEGTGILSKVAIDPIDENIIYAGSMGYPSRKGNERGLFRSVDGGVIWNKTLTIDDSTGVIDLVTDPVRPGYVYASGWTRLRSNKMATTVGPGTSMYRSKDYGATWENITDILPGNIHSRTSIDISSDGTLFISYMGFVQNSECAGYTESLTGIFKSHDGGTSWEVVPADPLGGLPCDLFGSFGWYFEALKVNPENPDDIFLLGVDLYRTLDGGVSWFLAAPEWWTYEVHADKHDLVFAAGKIILGTDGGAYRSPVDQSLPWMDIENIPSTQFYRTAFNPHLPDQYFGGAQDNGTSGGNAGILNEWSRYYGGDGFQPRFDPTEPSWAYYMIQYGGIVLTKDGFNFEPLDEGLFGTRYWDMPFLLDIDDPKILYCAAANVFRLDIRDSSRTWISISPDLTRGVNILGSRYPAITALAQSDMDNMRLYAGTQDGKVWTTPDGGINWMDITEGTPGFYVTAITCSTKNPEGVFATYSGYRDNDNTPYIYQSDDAGKTWISLGVNAPMAGVNDLFILPGWNDEVLFAATDGGVYVSFNTGVAWDRLGVNFPYMPVYDIDFNPVTNTIVAATFSRGLMTFPVEELDLISGVDANLQNSAFKGIIIYPTIVNDHVTLDFEKYQGDPDGLKISIIDITGTTIYKTTLEQKSNFTYNLDITPGIPDGVYFIQISNQDASNICFKIVKY
ncbi:MAG TPA: T9SS type A sorting domain-containing protein [Saprospiraceae bacterium]|nr:T9SS type A sorting domain-containing protein [Saprospiraceae bacterium]